jgi:hypothetical protein
MRERSVPSRSRLVLLSVLVHLGLLLPLLWWKFGPLTNEDPSWEPRAELRIVSISPGSSPPRAEVEEILTEPEEIPYPPRDLATDLIPGVPDADMVPVAGSPGSPDGRRRTAPVPLSLAWMSGRRTQANDEEREMSRTARPVLMRVYVTAQGSVSFVEPIDDRDLSPLDSTALDAARALRFRPATENGVPVAAWDTVEIQVTP